jgi:trans-2,3-dihydro-3-hydroxyanthranilate isomerase
VFAQTKYSGNQLAVITNAGRFTDEKMQNIANEMHFSETAFVQSSKTTNNGYNVRIFTPLIEVPFAGHPTLGTAYVIRNFLARNTNERVILNTKAGQIEVTFQIITDNEELCWMKQIPPTFGQKFSVEIFQDLIGVVASDFDSKYPIQEVSTGLPFIIVPLKTLESVNQVNINQASLAQLAKQVKAGILVFCPKTYFKENSLNVRVFVDMFGIPEDPATGSGNGCLAAYLSYYQYFGSPKVDAKVEQGFKIRRPSILYLNADKVLGKIEVKVGGKVLLIAKGKLL